jgi:hypothetical protein
VSIAAASGELDAAWAEAEAALPEGWIVFGVAKGYETDDGWAPEDEWRATAVRPEPDQFRSDGRAVSVETITAEQGKGETPAAALRALAAKLREAR